MKYLAAILFVAAAASAARADGSGSRCRGLDANVSALVSEYRGLRERRGRLPQGTFDQDLQADGGRFHRVLYSLGLEMGRPPYTRRTVVGCLGEPDAVKNGKQMRPFLDIYQRELRKAGREVPLKPGRVYLIYHWRGGHDFLFFITEGGRVVDHGWWFAYE
ncbi:MAG TPA: hypothetical protein VD861_05150 [Pyrinomonadaceae bacterium]|nr:hypothetical protein [Pyrinomonadaceae bacterium]